MLSYRVPYMISGMTIKMPGWYAAGKPTAKDERKRLGSGLYPKADGWYKSVGGKTRYVCKPMPLGDALGVLDVKLKRWGKGGEANRVVPVSVDGMTLEGLAELYLSAMLDRYRTGVPKPLARQTYDELVNTLDDFMEVVGPHRLIALMGQDDFSAYAKSLAGKALTTKRRRIQYVDMMFNWAGPGKRYRNLIPFIMRGPDWVKPSDDAIQTAAADNDKAYTAQQCADAFAAVRENPLLNAAAHLGLLCAMGPKDLGTLPESVVDTDAAEICFPRGKTGVARVCPLNFETVAAIAEWRAFRAKLKTIRPAAEGLLFRTRQGMPYARHFGGDGQDAGHKDNLLSRRWGEAVGLPFSGLRSTFATLADDWHDQRAVDMVLGHKVGKVGRHIRRHYAKHFNRERARELVDHVWRLAFDADARKRQSPRPAAG